MKLLHILSLLVVALVAGSSAQTCRNSHRNPTCTGPRNVGRVCRGCLDSNMWYYDARSRQCLEMRFWGASGNSNRWCTRAICEQRCRR